MSWESHRQYHTQGKDKAHHCLSCCSCLHGWRSGRWVVSCSWAPLQLFVSNTYKGLWGLVFVWLSWLNGRALAAQARGILGSTPGKCWLFHFPLFSPQSCFQFSNMVESLLFLLHEWNHDTCRNDGRKSLVCVWSGLRLYRPQTPPSTLQEKGLETRLGCGL